MTQIPLRGEFEDPTPTPTATRTFMRNAFVAAFSHSLEGSITLRDVATDVRCFRRAAGRDQPDEEQSRRERQRDRC